MTTPGGVPNLPQGALTLDDLASTLQDTSAGAMKSRAVERFPGIMDTSTGLSPASDFTPFGILTSIWAGVNSAVANADPADITGPEDLPALVVDFIESLPVVGQFVQVLEAILGSYDGEDQTLIAIQNIFAPIRTFMALFAGIPQGQFPTVEQIANGVGQLFSGLSVLQPLIQALVGGLTGGAVTGTDPASIAQALLGAPFQVAAQAFETLFGLIASLQAQITGVQNNPGGASLTDDFSSNVPSGRRTNVVGTMVVSSRGKYLQTVNLAADYMGTPGTSRKPATNKCGTAITIEAGMVGICRAWICGDAAMTNYAALEVMTGFDGDALRIVTGSAPDLVVVQAQLDLVASRLQSGNTYDIRYDPTANRYTVLRNGQDVGLSWVDSANIVTHAAGKTFTGAVANGDDRSEDGFYGPGIRKQTSYDW